MVGGAAVSTGAVVDAAVVGGGVDGTGAGGAVIGGTVVTVGSVVGVVVAGRLLDVELLDEASSSPDAAAITQITTPSMNTNTTPITAGRFTFQRGPGPGGTACQWSAIRQVCQFRTASGRRGVSRQPRSARIVTKSDGFDRS